MEKSHLNPKKRPKPVTITPIQASAPWILVSQAAAESGVGEKEIRETLPLRRFGNAHYVATQVLNDWILNGERSSK